MLGKVKWFSSKKGYGFVTSEDGKDYFVHHTNIQMDGYRKLLEGEKVSFDPEVNEKGDQAVNVKSLQPEKHKAEERGNRREGGAKRHGE